MLIVPLALILLFTVSVNGLSLTQDLLKMSLKPLRHHRPRGVSLYSTDRKDAQREEQWKLQQEILARRKNKTKLKEYFENVEKKRNDLAKEAKSSKWASTKDGEDPITIWQKAKADGKIKPLGYEPEPSKDSSKTGLNIVIPINPIGIPKYDNGERFDLRLPYAERGYEDPEADVM
eukprot:gene24650-32102_t